MSRAQQRSVDYAAMADVDLVAAMQSGAREAYGVVIQRHNQRLYRVARGILGDESEAEDVVQDAYVKAFSNLPGFRGQASLGTWLTRIVINQAIDRRRQRRRATSLDALDGTQPETQTSVVALHPSLLASNPEQDSARLQIRRLIEQAVDRLPEAFRIVFVMRDIEEMSIDETADYLDIPAATVKTRLHRARRLLRGELEDSLASALAGSFPFAGARCAQMTEAVLARLGI